MGASQYVLICDDGEVVILVGTMAAVIKQLRMLCPDGPVIDVFSRRGRVQ